MSQKWTPEEIEVVQKHYKPDSRNYDEIAEKLNGSRTPIAVEKFIKYSPFWKPTPERNRIKELNRENNILRQVVASLQTQQTYTLHSYEGEYARFGVISDTQLGSRFANMPFLSLAYDIFEREGIHTVYHPGDLVDGKMRHQGHEFELLVHGEDAQRDYCVNEYPRRDGIDTYFITGNHDLSFFKLSGSDIGEKIAQIRPDMHYLGQESADIDIETRDGKVKCNLSHPGKGTAYAISYHSQKHIESLERGTKPNIIFVGHFHKMEKIFYQNVHLIQTGTTQYQTPFMKRNNNAAMLGLWIGELALDEDSIRRCKAEWIPCYK